MEVSSVEKYENSIQGKAVKARCGAVLVDPIDVRCNSNSPKIVELAAKNRLPAISTLEGDTSLLVA